MRTLIYSLGFFISSLGFANISPIDSIREIEVHSEESENVLVVFDIDDTLTILSDPAFHRPNFKMHHAAVFKEIMAALNPKEQGLAFTIPLLTTPSDLIEIDTAEFIANLQKTGFRTIALTAAMGGEIEGNSIEDRRIAELNRVGIDFSHSFPNFSEIVFSGFKAPLLGRAPFFKNGVILANENDKGDVLVAFLKNIAWRPDCILFVDDRVEHLQAVQKALSASFPEIEFKGFHYQTERVPYASTDPENFSKKWLELAERAQAILANE